MMTGFLDGERVLALGDGQAVDLAGMYFADHGADVVKVEAPAGDRNRALPGWRVWNRGKRSVLLELSEPAARSSLGELIAGCDVVIDGLGEGDLDGLGFDWKGLHDRYPRLVLCRMTGYAGLSRHAGRPVVESLIAARTGQQWEQRGFVGGPIEHLLGRPGPDPDLELAPGSQQGADRPGPLHIASPFASVAASFLATIGISAALLQREASGEGQLVTTSLLQAVQALNFSGWQRPEHPDVDGYWMWVLDRRAPKGLFECADGQWIHQWPMNPAAVIDAAAATDVDAAATRNRDDDRRLGMGPEDLIVLQYYFPQLVDAFKRYDAEEWVALGQRIDVGAQPVRSPEAALADPALLADGAVVEVADPEVGRIRHVGVPFQLLAAPGRVDGPAPEVGADTAAVLASWRPRPVPSPALGPVPAPHFALGGIRVVDLGLGVAGPFATQMLADLGADVVKVNTLWDGFWLATHMGVGVNRGKRSLAVNLKDPRGRDAVRRLCEGADVVAHNMRGGVAERLGLDYASVATTNPSVVYCHSRGFDRGVRLPLPATDQTAAALAGGEWEDGGCRDGGQPFWSPTSLGDIGNGFLSAMAIVQGLLYRARTGEGQLVDTSILNACLLVAGSTWIDEAGKGPSRRHLDRDQLGFDALNRLYQAADGWVCVAARPDQRALVLQAVRAPDPGDPSDDGLAASLAEAIIVMPVPDVVSALDAVGVPAEASSDTFAHELFADEEAWARGLLVRQLHPTLGTLEQYGHLVELSDSPGRLARPSPLCGQHSVEILGELGLSDADIDDLVTSGVVRDGRPDLT
jgi:crotonobetainyl-CoA:carnitine CoA-transferase CaiB-like acyl-CoA transferase